ncbi:uncharacterized protein UDID_17196 [Ustilago sp. UG-2017a]|nr:uncharacterized protein UDID_17196 [Ustilago sp. UG-2017a]
MLASGICYNLPTQGLKQYFEDFGGYSLSMFALAVNLICMGLTICIQARNRSHFTRMGGIFLFAMCTPIWYSVTSMMATFCHFRGFIKFEKWNPTARTSANSKTNTSTANSRVRSNTDSIIRWFTGLLVLASFLYRWKVQFQTFKPPIIGCVQLCV